MFKVAGVLKNQLELGPACKTRNGGIRPSGHPLTLPPPLLSSSWLSTAACDPAYFICSWVGHLRPTHTLFTSFLFTQTWAFIFFADMPPSSFYGPLYWAWMQTGLAREANRPTAMSSLMGSTNRSMNSALSSCSTRVVVSIVHQRRIQTRANTARPLLQTPPSTTQCLDR